MKMHEGEYTSSIDKNLKLTAEFHIPPDPRPLCLFFHGWHMTAASARTSGFIQPLLEHFFLVNVDMRGRSKSSGRPDSSGHELIDGLDGLEYARENWKDRISPDGLYAVGGSGGGGNVLSLAGKAPDIFSAAVSWAGMSDYAVWYRDDIRGRYRDEMEDKKWIGGNPGTNPEGYRSRSGLSVVENVLTRLLVIHGRKDVSVPVISTELYEARIRELEKSNITVHYNDKGHSSIEWPLAMEHLLKNKRQPQIPRFGRFLVHSFLALRSFWIILENPSDMGYSDYSLDSEGNLQSLSFHLAYSHGDINQYLVRLFTCGKKVEITDGSGNKIDCVCCAPGTKKYNDFSFRCKGDFTLQVTG